MKKSFAKYMALLLTAVFAFSAVGCGKDEAKQQETAVVEKENTEENEEQQAAPDYVLQDAMMVAEGAPELTASAAILIEESTGTILYGKEAVDVGIIDKVGSVRDALEEIRSMGK